MSPKFRKLVQVTSVVFAATVATLGTAFYVTVEPPAVPKTVVQDEMLPAVQVNGVRLHAEAFGDPSRPVVVALHGGPGNDYRYLLPLRRLADDYYVVFYDQRGSGLSQRVSDDALTLQAFYDDLDAVVELYGKGKRVRLIGHSWGAMLASGYLGRHPDKVLQAVLAEPGMLTPETARLLMARTNDMQPELSWSLLPIAARIALHAARVTGPDRDARRDLAFGELMSSPSEESPIAGYFCDGQVASGRMESWRFGARVAPALLGAAREQDGTWRVSFAEGVERYRRKVLFLAGSCNQIIGEELQRRHMALFPETELVVIEGAGHTMFGEKPEESLAAVRSYFAEAQGVPE